MCPLTTFFFIFTPYYHATILEVKDMLKFNNMIDSLQVVKWSQNLGEFKRINSIWFSLNWIVSVFRADRIKLIGFNWLDHLINPDSHKDGYSDVSWRNRHELIRLGLSDISNRIIPTEIKSWHLNFRKVEVNH